MDSFEQEPLVSSNETKIELTRDSLYSLDTTRRWANFLAVLGFIFIVLMVLVGIIMGVVFSSFGGEEVSPALKILLPVVYLLLAAIYFFPVLFLFRFANWTKKALANNSSLDFSVALKNLKSHFKFIGIMIIAVFVLYFLILIGVLIFGVVSNF